MEEEIIGGREHPPPPPPPPPPPLLFLRGKNHNNISFSSSGDLKIRFTKEKPQELHNKTFQAYRNGWFILLNSYSPRQLFRIYKYTLWNPSTSEFIHLPQLKLRGEKTIKSCTLSSSPGNPDCMLILFETQVPSIIFCRIGVEYEHWNHQKLELKVFGEVDYLFGHAMLNGTLYSSTRRGRLVKLDLDCPNYDRLGLTLLDDCFMPCSQENSPSCARYMVEFCGEIFLIYLVIKGLYNSACQVIDVEVFTLDFSNMVWSEVRSFKDKAFFVGPYGSFSYSCIGSGKCRGIRGNHVYFTLPKDESLYSFNMSDKTISVSFPCSSNIKSSMEELKLSWRTPIWIMPDSSLSIRVNNTKAKGDSHVAKPHENREISKRARLDQAEGEFSKLPTELLIAISKLLLPQDRMNFTTVITRLPPIPWNQLASELFSQYSNTSLKPWLMVLRKGDLNCNFTNLWGGKYSFEIHEDQFKNVTVACSKEGWCLMLRGEHSIFLWNPMTNKTIHFPDMRYKRQQYFCFGFSMSPIKKVVLMGSHLNGDIFIDYISLGEGEWNNSFIPISASPPASSFSNTMTFYRGAFYILDNYGDLFVFGDETGLNLLNVVNKPLPSFHQRYLVQCEGKLVSVIVGSLGEWVRIFYLDESGSVWFEVKNLGECTIYVSRYSSLAVATVSRTKNRVYFPRYYGKGIVYYSLCSERLHVQDSEEVLDNFYNTKEQLLSTWIQPSSNDFMTRRRSHHRYQLRNVVQYI